MTNLAELRNALQRYLDEHGNDWSRIGDLEPFGDGHSGFTYLLQAEGVDGKRDLVLRVSPPGARITGTADIGRQARIMQGLRAAGMPAPEIFAHSSGPVLAGRSFLLASRIPGDDWRRAREEHGDSILYAEAANYLTRMQSLPMGEVAIACERALTPELEAGRWSVLLERAPDEVSVPGTQLFARLLATAPPPADVVLVHGDFHYGNMIFDAGRLAAVVDWEIASIGDPLIDRSSLAVAVLRRQFADEVNTMGDIEVSIEQVMAPADTPARAQWFVALACAKYSAIIGYNLGLHRSGRRPDPIYERLLPIAQKLNEYGAGQLE